MLGEIAFEFLYHEKLDLIVSNPQLTLKFMVGWY